LAAKKARRRQALRDHALRVQVSREMMPIMTALERRYLARFICLGCEMSLDRDYCGAVNPAKHCTAESRAERRAKVLEGYRP
jgi:hypothetical protein